LELLAELTFDVPKYSLAQVDSIAKAVGDSLRCSDSNVRTAARSAAWKVDDAFATAFPGFVKKICDTLDRNEERRLRMAEPKRSSLSPQPRKDKPAAAAAGVAAAAAETAAKPAAPADVGEGADGDGELESDAAVGMAAGPGGAAQQAAVELEMAAAETAVAEAAQARAAQQATADPLPLAAGQHWQGPDEQLRSGGAGQPVVTTEQEVSRVTATPAKEGQRSRLSSVKTPSVKTPSSMRLPRYPTAEPQAQRVGSRWRMISNLVLHNKSRTPARPTPRRRIDDDAAGGLRVPPTPSLLPIPAGLCRRQTSEPPLPASILRKTSSPPAQQLPPGSRGSVMARRKTVRLATSSPLPQRRRSAARRSSAASSSSSDSYAHTGDTPEWRLAEREVQKQKWRKKAEERRRVAELERQEKAARATAQQEQKQEAAARHREVLASSAQENALTRMVVVRQSRKTRKTVVDEGVKSRRVTRSESAKAATQQLAEGAKQLGVGLTATNAALTTLTTLVASNDDVNEEPGLLVDEADDGRDCS
jgi:hypothetical protein